MRLKGLRVEKVNEGDYLVTPVYFGKRGGSILRTSMSTASGSLPGAIVAVMARVREAAVQRELE